MGGPIRASVCQTDQTGTLLKLDQGNNALDITILEYVSSQHMSDKIQAFCLKKTLDSNSRSLSTPGVEIPVTTDLENTLYVIGQLSHLADLVLQRLPTPFIHPELHSDTLRHFLVTSGQKEVDFVVGISSLDERNTSLLNLVTATQILILFLSHAAFGEKQERPIISQAFKLLARWRGTLWASARDRMPSDLSPWHNWVLAESIRRTILMSYLVEGLFSAWTKGWCCHSLFISALPLCPNGKLWLAETAAEWTNLTTSGKTDADLMFFHEFSESFTRKPWNFGDDDFQRLILTTHHGREAVEEKLKLYS